MNHSETITIECTINGMPFQLHAAPGTPLSELLREQGLLSVKQGCCVGECGACTVLVDGTAIDSCLYLAALGLKEKRSARWKVKRKAEKLSHVQQAYAKSGAVQCGFCTPGLIMATTAMLAKPREKPLTITEIRRGLAGNLCRCTGYQMIVKYSSGLRENEVKDIRPEFRPDSLSYVFNNSYFLILR
ncbi:xanthine dehydrogenase iron sulfur-binding subunit XdhC [Escherichia coli]